MLKYCEMQQTIRFGPYTIDPDRLVLRKHNVRVKLQRQPFKLLLLLIDRRGSVVDRDTMIQELWGDGTQVDFDRSLNFCVSQIRSALSDDAASPKYIETVHREGYRFLGEIDPGEQEVTEQPPAPAPPDRRRFMLVAAGGIASVAGAGVLLSRFSARKTATPPSPIPLTGLAGRLGGPAFSPDGKQIAFSWMKEDRPRRAEIHVKLIGSAETLALTTGDGLDEFPVWAPDGKTIYFTREQGADVAIWQVPALGGSAKRIAYLGPAPFYGFKFRRPFDILPAGGFLGSFREAGRGWLIVRIGENGEKGETLTAPPKGSYDHNPTASPDGRSFLFIRSVGGDPNELHVQSFSGGQSKVLVKETWVHSACWAPDGKSVLYCPNNATSRGIWLVPKSGGEARLVQGAGAKVQDITFSQAGDLAAFTEENPRHDLWSAPLRDAGAPRPLIVSGRIHDSPHFSPDGKRLAFYSNRAGRMQVWIADASGGGVHPLTDGLYPNWSPDGRRLVYQSQDGIRTIGADGGAAEIVWSRGNNYATAPSWSPDGKWIYVESNLAGGIDIWKFPAKPGDGAPVRVTQSGGSRPQVFEGFLYFRRRDVGTMRLPLDGGEEVRMGPAGNAHAAMPGGLYVLTLDMQLLQIDYATKSVMVVRRLDKPSSGSSLAISPDESSVVYAYQADAGHEIMLVRDLNWG